MRGSLERVSKERWEWREKGEVGRKEVRRTGSSMPPDIWFPVFSAGVCMMCQILWPTPLNNISHALTLHHDLVLETTCLSQNDHIQRII